MSIEPAGFERLREKLYDRANREPSFVQQYFDVYFLPKGALR